LCKEKSVLVVTIDDGGDESPPNGSHPWRIGFEAVSSKLREQHRYSRLPASALREADFF
jgi:hypothetical protein